MADLLADVAAKSDVKIANSQMTTEKWARR